jgi:integrase
MRTGAKAKQANVRKTQTDDGRRARQATANRVLTVLKAALNLAYREGYAPSDDAWRRVKPFGKVDAPKIRYLNDAEAVRLVNRCGPDLRNLVTAALLTGCRYGELTRLASSDFDKGAGLIHIRETKSGKPRTVPLTEEGRAFFTGMGAGKVGAALLLTRDGMAWGDGHQHRPLAEACREAKIEPVISFHILRHSAASRLVQRGVPMAVIAKLLGNSEAICAKHYAHLSQDYVNETIRSAGGAIGIFAETNVIPLHAAG